MAELPRMVMALKGSATLRTASQAFSFGRHRLDLRAVEEAGVPVDDGDMRGQGTDMRKGWFVRCASTSPKPAW